MLAGLFDRVHANVESDVAVQRSLERHLDRQLEALMQGESDQLPVLLDAMERDLVRSRELQAARAQLLSQMRDTLGAQGEELDLDELAAAAGSEVEGWEEQRAQWREAVLRVRRRNREVALLMRHSLRFVRDLRASLAGDGAATVPRGPITYGASGRLGRSGGTSLAVEG